MANFGKKFMAGALVLACLSIAPQGNAAGGSVDPGFNTNGYLVVNDDTTPNSYESILSVASQGEKLILVGERAGQLYVARLNASGQLDLSFGGQNTGYVTAGGYYQADKIAVLNDGSFFVLGSGQSGSTSIAVLLKFNSNGTPDLSFTDVVIDGNFNSIFDNFYAKDLVLSPTQDSVYVLLNGFKSSNQYSSSALHKFSLAGIEDSSFHENYFIGTPSFDAAITYASQYPTSLAVFGNYVYVGGYSDYGTNNQTWTIGQLVKLNSNGTRDNSFPSPNRNYRPSFVSLNPAYSNVHPYDERITDIETSSTGDIYVAGVFNAPGVIVNGSWTYEESEFFVKKVNSLGSEEFSNVIFRENYSTNNDPPSIDLYSDNKVLLAIPYISSDTSSSNTRILRLTPSLTSNDFGTGGFIDLPDTYRIRSILLHANQRIVVTGGYGDMSDNGFIVGQLLSFDPPSSPTIGTATATGSTTATVSFTAPISNGGATVTSYTATSSPGGFTGVLSGATAGTITVTGLSASTSYTFTVTATNSEGTSTASATSNSVTTSVTSGGGGTGGGTTTSTAADELKRQQEAAQAAKQKQDQELKEILSLVPTIAGLAQGIAGLGNSLLLPKKCVKGKVVKNVKAGAKCPKGYKVKK
jgi:hypothetical protein